MTSELSVHDNLIYAHSFDCEQGRLTLHTSFRDGDVEEHTDVVFRDVIAYHFEHVLPGNILFDIVVADIASVVRDYADMFRDSWRHGWPPVSYAGDLDLLVEILRSRYLVAYAIESSYGLSGWVIAGVCERKSRSSRAKMENASEV